MARTKLHRSADLECTVLGIVSRIEPCTPYEISAQMASATEAVWRGSKGTIYPLVRRLVQAGLLASTQRKDRRGTVELSLTGKGRAKVADWLNQAPDGSLAVSDPLRARFRYLTALPAEDRIHYIQQCLVGTQSEIEEIEKLLGPGAGDSTLLDRLDLKGLLLQLEARRSWLAEALVVVPAALDGPAEPSGDAGRRRADNRHAPAQLRYAAE